MSMKSLEKNFTSQNVLFKSNISLSKFNIETKLYEKLGMTSEYYENNEDKYYTASRVVIYSISLTGKPCEKWNSKNLSLGSHEEWNKR